MPRALGRRLAGRSDRGTTIVELTAVMLIMGIVLAATATLAIGFTRTNAENFSRQTQLDDARSATERISQTLRTAVKPSQLITVCFDACSQVDAFMQGNDLSVAFYANIDNPGNSKGPSRITYTVATSGDQKGVLWETQQTPEDAYPATPEIVDAGTNGYIYCNATDIHATEECKSHYSTRRLTAGVITDAPVFTYYDRYGTELPTGAAGLSTEYLDKVLAVQIQVTVQSTTVTKAKPTTYIQRITLPNAQAVMRQDEEDNE